MRSYNVPLAAHALDVPTKWLDNLLAHCAVPGVGRARRGVERRIAPRALVVIAAARLIGRTLRVPRERAVALAERLCAPHAQGVCRIAPELTVSLDVTAIERTLQRRLVDAAEVTARARRGRPPRSAAP